MILTEAEIRYQEKLNKRMAELQRYWKKNPGQVKIVLSEEDRAVLTSASTGAKTGIKWAKLDRDYRATHTQMLNETTWNVMQKNPAAFYKEQFEFMQRYAKSKFKVVPMHKISRI